MFSGTFSHAPELIILLIIALVIFGPKKLPDLGKGLGQGIKEFRRATTGEEKPAEAEKQGESALPEHIAQSSAVAAPAVPPEPVAPPAPAVPAENHQSPASAPAKAD